MTDRIETFRNIEECRAATHHANIIGKENIRLDRPRTAFDDVDPELPEEWADRDVIKASESPTLKRRREAELERQRGYAKRYGRLEEFDAKIKAEEDRKAAREALEAEARKALEEEAEEARLERVKARLRREVEAVGAQ